MILSRDILSPSLFVIVIGVYIKALIKVSIQNLLNTPDTVKKYKIIFCVIYLPRYLL